MKPLARAVFLDRDGTVNVDVDHLHRREDLRLLPGVAKAIGNLNKLGFLVVLVTNQAAIAKGILTESGLDEIHALLFKRLGRERAHVDAVYYCPHHPGGNIAKYAIRCRCRKPEIGMIMKAVRRFKIDVKKSFLIGDTTNDILTGHRAGLTTILVKTGYGGRDKKHEVKPDFVVRNLTAAVRRIASL